MVSNKQKGDKAELEVNKILLNQGFIINPAPRTMKRVYTPKGIIYVSQRNDHWGLFDVEARHKETPRVTFHIQVKSNAIDVSKTKPKIMDWFNKYCKIETDYVEIWLRVSRKSFIRYCYVHKTRDWEKEYSNLKGDYCEPFKITNKGQK